MSQLDDYETECFANNKLSIEWLLSGLGAMQLVMIGWKEVFSNEGNGAVICLLSTVFFSRVRKFEMIYQIQL